MIDNAGLLRTSPYLRILFVSSNASPKMGSLAQILPSTKQKGGVKSARQVSS